MKTTEILDIGADKNELREFLELARDEGPLRVKIGDDVFSVKVSPETVSTSAREFLTKSSRDRNPS